MQVVGSKGQEIDCSKIDLTVFMPLHWTPNHFKTYFSFNKIDHY